MRTSKKRASGQAMAEMLVVASLFSAFALLGLAAIGNLEDSQANLLMQSRYAAWERTVWIGDTGWDSSAGTLNAKSDEAVRDEMMQRVIGQSKLPFTQADASNSALPATVAATLYDPAGGSLLASPNDVTLGFNYTGACGAVSSVSSAACSAPDVIAGAMSALGYVNAGLPLSTTNRPTATVSWTLGAQSTALRELMPGWSGVTSSDHTAILTNTWTPDGSTGSQALFSHAVPATLGAFQSVGDLAFGLAPWSADITGLQIGKVAPDVVPSDRLAPAK